MRLFTTMLAMKLATTASPDPTSTSRIDAKNAMTKLTIQPITTKSSVVPIKNHGRFLNISHPKLTKLPTKSAGEAGGVAGGILIWYSTCCVQTMVLWTATHDERTSESRSAKPPRNVSRSTEASRRTGFPIAGVCVKCSGELKKSNARAEIPVRSHETTTST